MNNDNKIYMHPFDLGMKQREQRTGCDSVDKVLLTQWLVALSGEKRLYNGASDVVH